MTFELHPDAAEEYLASIAWYDTQVEGLGIEFSREIEKAFDRIMADPGRYRLADAVFRIARIDRFPYSIFYYWDPAADHILVATIFHQRRRPGAWQDRFLL